MIDAMIEVIDKNDFIMDAKADKLRQPTTYGGYGQAKSAFQFAYRFGERHS
jgi:hypothetical protein